MLNRIILMGRLVKDPELRYTQSQKPVASFTLAVDRDFSGNGDKQTDFVNCAAWNSAATFICNNFHKGKMMALVGKLQSKKWTDKAGQNRTDWEVVADNIYFCGDKAEKPSTGLSDLDDYDGEIPF